ncbi:endonuclease domain-containing protein [Microbacterium sp. zg.Y1084]|uniref:endonuclease domain-containing protein n=1 Tax=Microbacterium sp. zg.Y1084 TaxID=2969667 RepID=UPI00214CF69E|nr:DUF559 domain-containing protein [Microbacterium sp. zg.Y1084]MCR2813894.1 DUF559 domain-containing protein [Microbacterium sp. zg.Y1084]
MLRRPLPAFLLPAFTTADATAAGVGRSRLRAADLEHPFHAVYVVRDGRPPVLRPEDEIMDRAAIAHLRLSDGTFFSHLTAAVLWGVPLPPGILLAHDELDVAVLHPRRPARARGLRGHRVQPEHVRLTIHPEHGLPVPTPASTWAMLGSVLRHPYDLVAVADALVSDRRYDAARPLATRAQLEAAVFTKRRVGVRALREALVQVRPRVASRTETWTRLVIVDAGLPEPLINHSVVDGAGRFIACVDLAYPQWKVAVEYEGAHHLFDATQWASDIRRYEQLAAEGWRVIRVTSDELFLHPERLALRVRRAIRAAA